jgi:hypothetical protein
VVFSAAGSWNQSPVLQERLLAALGRMSAAAFFIHAENDYSTASGPALAAEMQRLAKAHALKIYPPFGEDMRAGHNFIFRSVRTWESDVFAFLNKYLRRERNLPMYQATFRRESIVLSHLMIWFQLGNRCHFTPLIRHTPI